MKLQQKRACIVVMTIITRPAAAAAVMIQPTETTRKHHHQVLQQSAIIGETLWRRDRLSKAKTVGKRKLPLPLPLLRRIWQDGTCQLGNAEHCFPATVLGCNSEHVVPSFLKVPLQCAHAAPPAAPAQLLHITSAQEKLCSTSTAEAAWKQVELRECHVLAGFS